MLRSTLLYLSEMRGIQRFIMGHDFSRKSAQRFVAGEKRQDAIEAARVLNQKGIEATLDHLGENVSHESEAAESLAEYLALLDDIHQSQVRSHISVKLTALGLDISRDLCQQAVRKICQRARDLGSFVRIDMEGSKYTDVTMDVYRSARAEFENVGLALQAYLYRTEKDVEELLKLGGKFRLCKGAYKEPASVAFQAKADVDKNYVKLMKRLMTSGIYHGIATHDERIIRTAQEFARQEKLPRSAFEFQMLHGIRRDLQAELARDFNLRIYVPYGTNWYPYLMRRLAERPANVWFIVSNAFR
ncbi:MAG: proline dehydrogenase family protein [Candidatus Riflebacteria bacterium]|nr:proline dehydrogenase family protein [Candidatus Riflebacteria bacterium]